MMIVEFLWYLYLGSTVQVANGWEISLALSLEGRETISFVIDCHSSDDAATASTSEIAIFSHQ